MMARMVKDFDAECKDGKYVVKAEVDNELPAVTIYDNMTGTEKMYYSIFAKPIRKIRKNKDCYVLYI